MTQRQVILEGGVPWGFRMYGGDELRTPLKVYRVNPGSKAAQRGIREGDYITSINGLSTKNLNNNEAHNLLKTSGSTLTLGLNEDTEGSPKRRHYRTVHQETHQETVKRSSLTYSIKESIETSSSEKDNYNELRTFNKATNESVKNRDTKQNGSDVRVITNIPVSQKSTPSSSSTSTPSTLIPEGRNTVSDHALASRQSSYSNCSSIPDEGLEQTSQECPDLESREMNNEDGRLSKSKKRRQRRKNNLLNRSFSDEGNSAVEEINSIAEESCSEDKEETLQTSETPGGLTNQRIEILKLKRVEHKYKVESPKEVKVEHVKSIDKKLKCKSKSLDDDEIIRIQELSEASESEDAKTQSNVIISEASSEENLIEDLDSKVQEKQRKPLDSISLQLNEQNQIEVVSLISPAEEQALRTFLGGLNLVESPEESAKELYERTAELTDPKTKKQQKRKELEEYFLPIAENPRFLDAISEEASDISDKETSSTSKTIHHIKQCTPEQDVRQIPPPIPPRANKRSGLGRYGNQVEQPDAILVETKILKPESVQDTVCGSQIDEETAEVVYLHDSNESSISSEDFEDAINEFQQENSQSDGNNEPTTKNMEEKTTPQPNKAGSFQSELKNSELNKSYSDSIQVESNESLSTTFSSHTSSSTKIGTFADDKALSISSDYQGVLSQLTPPPTPDDVTAKNIRQSSPKTTNSVLFDYTRIPNILSSKEPEDSFKAVKGGSMEKNVLENESEKDTVDLKKTGGAKQYTDASTTKLGDVENNFTVKNTDINHVAAMHMTKRIVNGQLDSMEVRKVAVDEVFKDGDVEVKKDFEEFKTKRNPNKLNEFDMHLEDTKNKEQNKESITKSNEKTETDTCKPINRDIKDYRLNESIDLSKNEDPNTKHKVITDAAPFKNQETSDLMSKSLKNLKVINESNDKTCSLIVSNEVSKDVSSFASNEHATQENDVDLLRDHVSDKITIEKQSSLYETRSENSFLKENLDMNLLRHVIMTSSDSNKTDSQKLKDFNNIRMLNSELKDKINKKELIGPAFAKSKSPCALKEDTVVMHCCNDLPGKTFVQRRIKEFSEEAHRAETVINTESSLVTHNGISSESEESLINKDWVKSRIKEFSHKEEANTEEGSILKRIILNSNADNGNNKERNEEIVQGNKIDVPIVHREKNIPISIENFTTDTTKLSPNKKIIPAKIDQHFNDLRTPYNAEETIIPITIEQNIDQKNISIETNENERLDILTRNKELKVSEDSEEDIITGSVLKRIIINDSMDKTHLNKTEEEYKHEKNDLKETIIPISIKGSLDKISKIPEQDLLIKTNHNERLHVFCENKDTEILSSNDKDKNTGSVLKRIILNNNESETEEKLHQKETIIPIVIEKSYIQHQNAQDDLNKEIIIPIKIENDSKLQTKNTVQEKIIPITIENIQIHKNTEDTIFQETYKDASKSLEQIAAEKYASTERLIPINLEEKGSLINNQNELKRNENVSKEKVIPIKIETESVASNDNKNILEFTKEAINITKGSLQEVNNCLKNITENKKYNKDLKNQSSDTKLEMTHKQELKSKNESVIATDNIKKDSTTNIEKKKAPPIPPPRRSKKNVTKKEYEMVKSIPQNEPLKNDSKTTLENLVESTASKKIDSTDSKEKIHVSNDITYTNILSPPRPASAGSDSTDSEESSRCTAKYNPNSSIADVTSITKEELEENGENKRVYEPMSLRNIVVKFFLSLPFGEEILKELAEVSKSIDSFTHKIPFKGLSGINSDNNDILVNKEENMPRDWYTQKDVVKNEYGDERRKILELHEKFITRRSYSEGDDGSVRGRDVITGIGSREMDVMSPNRLLTIIREEPNETENVNFFGDDTANQRLKAKNLGEWLTLARHKSKSTSNLDCTNIPINNLRKTFTNAPADQAKFSNTRRRSLPQEIYEKQLIDIMEKEREIQRELEKLEEEKRKLRAEIAPSKQKEFQVDDFYVSKKGDFAEMREHPEKGERPMSMPVFPTEFFRQQMYDEYMDKFSERQERKQQKVIKISSSNDLPQEPQNLLKTKEIIHPIEIEQEFMDKVKQKMGKIDETQDDVDTLDNPKSKRIIENLDQGTSEDDSPVIVLDGDKVKGIETLPKHLQEFVDDLTALPESSVWSPGQPRYSQTSPTKSLQRAESQNSQSQGDEPISPIWTPKSATSSPTADRKEFRTVSFQSPVLSRKNRTNSETIRTPDSTSSEPPWKLPRESSDTAINLSSSLDRRLPTSQSSPGFGSFSTSPRLPRAQNPTITLLQKAREGQLPRGAHYIDQDRRLPNDRPPIKYPGEVLYHIRNEYTSESDSERPRKMADLAPRKFEGIGPTSKDGMPLILRSEVQEKDQSKWYKRMYDTIHKQKPHRDEFVTVRYKQKRAQYPYTSGYLSEPEPGAYDSDFTDYKYQTLDRRRMPQTQNYISNNVSSTMPRSVPDKSYSSTDIIRNTQETYQPGRIENYTPGRSSISDKEAKQWWDEVMDIFDGHLEQQTRVPPQKPKSFINQALKESGYESDSTLVFRRKEDTANQLSPKEQRQAYKMIQKGGDVPFKGLRKLAPERPKESPRKYVENEVTIHYKTPVRSEIKEYVSEDELAHRQAEAMKKIYEEERKRKYFQELQDMKSRRHTDNFIPSQKSPISLNRYDDFDDLHTPTKTRPRSPEPRLVARALYNFVGQTARELTFRKGDLVYVRRQVDKNWYEGELNAMIGLFPVNYVEIIPYEAPKTTTTRKAHEGQARAKFNFLAQTHLELSLAKGELVTITRRVDDNWFEGKIGGRKGIFPVAYVDILIDPSDPPPPSTKPVASPAAHSLLLNGSAQGKDSMGSHLYTPNIPNPITSRDTGYHHAKPVQLTGTGTYSTLPKSSSSPIDQTLHIETHSDPVPYRALYRYTPQNDDELELLEGDTVFVLEKCDDGWYVGSSDRTGAFGTFPGNYVEKM